MKSAGAQGNSVWLSDKATRTSEL